MLYFIKLFQNWSFILTIFVILQFEMQDSNKEDDQKKSDSFQFPSFDSAPQGDDVVSKSNTLSINIEEEEEDKFEFPQNENQKSTPEFSFSDFPPIDGSNSQIDAFQFSFDNFQPDQQNDQSTFTFDANDDANSKKEEEQLYQKFVSLISNPCFEYQGKPLKELFKQDDNTESIDAAYDLLIQAYK